MQPATIGMMGFLLCLILIFFGVPIAAAAGVVGILGSLWLHGPDAVWTMTSLYMFNTANNFPLANIPFFIIMGLILFECGIGDEIFTAMRNWFGHLPGGLATAVTLACAAMGTCTGSSEATSATMAKMAYPQMKKSGYDPSLAFGVISGAASLAAIIPPSVSILVYGSLAGTTLGPLMIAGFAGGIIEAVTYAVMIFIRVKLNPGLAPLSPPAPWQVRLISLRFLIPPIIMLLIVTGGIYYGVCTATEAGGLAALASFVIVLAMRRLTWTRLRSSIIETCRTTVLVMIMFIGITILTRFLIISGFLISFTQLALVFPNKLITLGLVLIIYIILGMFLDAIGMLMITTPILVPAITALGYSPVWFGIIAIKMCEIAWITPPVAMNVFIVHSFIPELSLSQGYKAILPFLACDVITLIIHIVFPQTLLFLPGLMK